MRWLHNLWCPTLKKLMSVEDLTDSVSTKGGNLKKNVYMIRYYDIHTKLFPKHFRYLD